jgi:hypothetical protein
MSKNQKLDGKMSREPSGWFSQMILVLSILAVMSLLFCLSPAWSGNTITRGTTGIIHKPLEGGVIWNSFNGSTRPGDCDGGGTVSIDEVQSAINMYLGLKSPAVCVDINSNGVSIDEVQKVINGYLGL